MNKNKLKLILVWIGLLILISMIVLMYIFSKEFSSFIGTPSEGIQKLINAVFFMFFGFVLGSTYVHLFGKKRYIHVKPKTEHKVMSSSRREQQHEVILALIDALGYEPLEIPTGGKSKIKAICLKRYKLFTDSSFDHAWKDGTNKSFFRLLDSEKFTSNKI
jgi:hypothetical protein